MPDIISNIMTTDHIIQITIASISGVIAIIGFLIAWIFNSLKDEVMALRGSAEELNKNVALIVAKVGEHEKDLIRVNTRIEFLERRSG